MEGYIGSLVSMDCGGVLGTYQGQVVSINSAEHTITIANAFQNGIACLVPRITLNAADIHKLQIVLNAVDAQKASRTVNKHIGLVPRDGNVHGVGSEATQVSPEMSEISAALGITNFRQPNFNQNGGHVVHQHHLRLSPSSTFDSSLSSSGESNCSTTVVIPLYPEKLESSPNISLSAKKSNKSDRAHNGIGMNGTTLNFYASKNGNVNGLTSKNNAASNGRNTASNGISSKNIALNGFMSKNAALNGLSPKNIALNGLSSKTIIPKDQFAGQNGFGKSYMHVNQYANSFVPVIGVSRPKSANGRKHPNETGLIMDGNGLKDDNRSRSAGDFNKMCELGGMTSEEWLNSSVKSHPTSFESLRKRNNSASEVNGHKIANYGHKSSTPRKDKRNQSSRNQTKEDCLNAPIDADIDVDFDFESNLALFDKLAVYEEMESDLNMSIPVPCGRISEQKYRCDENILDGPTAANIVYRQIKFKNGADEVSSSTNGVNGMKCRREFVTDSGLIVPCIGVEMKNKLFSLAEQYGFTAERRSEMIGRSAGEMVLQLLGGSNRFNPKNSHQCPVVVVMCGTGMDAISGINCARQIAGRALSVIVFLPDKSTSIDAINIEMKLFSLTGGLITTDINDLLGSPVDMIVTALGSHEYNVGGTRSWYENALSWANKNKAPVLALEPPLDGGGLTAKWCLSASLPLPFSEHCGQVYLSDLGIPQQVYREIGIVYRSPFSHKFVIPLYDT